MWGRDQQSRTTHVRRLAVAAAIALPAAVARPADAQVFASERGLVAQTVNGTNVTVEYYRPVARGRELFGQLVRWGRPWTPGANWATTIEVDHDVRIEGQPLPKGKYGIWAIPQADEWTIILHRTARAFHTRKPAESDELMRLKVKPAQGAHVEVLTWSFPLVTKDSTELHLQWGTTDVALRMGIGPAAMAAAALTPEQRAVYVGTYAMTHTNPNARVQSSTYTVKDSAGVLRLHRSNPPDDYYDAQFDLHRTGEHTFMPIMYRKGVLVGVEPAITIIFTVESGRATAIENRFATGMAAAKGTRQP